MSTVVMGTAVMSTATASHVSTASSDAAVRDTVVSGSAVTDTAVESGTRDTVGAAPRSSSSKRPLRLTTRGRGLLAGLALIALAALGFGTASALAAVPGAAATDTEVTVDVTYITVQPGQTLWGIASTVAADRDVRDVVAEISTLNGLQDAQLEPGQRLALPSWV